MQRQAPGARNGLWTGQSANPDFIAAIDLCADAVITLDCIRNTHRIHNTRRAGTIHYEVAFLHPAHYSRRNLALQVVDLPE